MKVFALKYAILTGTLIIPFNLTFSADSDSTIKLKSTVIDSIASLPINKQPDKRLTRIISNIQAGSNSIRSTSYLDRSESNLIGIRQLVKGGVIDVSRRALSLQGILELAYTETFTSDSEPDHLTIQAGEIFMPLSIPKFPTTNVSMNTTSIQGDLSLLLHPPSNSQFSYTHVYEQVIIIMGTYGTTKTGTIKATVNCTTGIPINSKSLHAGLSASYIPVKCDELRSNGDKIIRQLAFLEDSMTYLLLSVNGEKHSEEHNFVSFSYSDQ